MSKLRAIILAAGKGTRMKSELPKVIHEILEKPMVQYVIHAANEAGAEISDICLVTGYQSDMVQDKVKDNVRYAIQTEQLGTGHAVKCAKDFIEENEDSMTLILCGDTPLITGQTLKALAEEHKKSGSAVTVLSAMIKDPTGYGRIIKNASGEFIEIVEQKDATPDQLAVQEINSGIYVFDSKVLSRSLDLLDNNNAQGEYYLTDTIAIIKNNGMGKVSAMAIQNANEVKGVNSIEQLKEAEDILKNDKHMKENKVY